MMRKKKKMRDAKKPQRRATPCILCGKRTTAKDGVCLACSDEQPGMSDQSDAMPRGGWDDEEPFRRSEEDYHGDLYRDDI